MTIAYHASPEADIQSFRPGTHFGSAAAAAERSTATKYADDEMTLYEVEISLSNPLVIYDEGGPHDVAYLVDAILTADRKALNPFAVEAIRVTAAQDQSTAMDLLAQAMLGRGTYDGLVYDNTTEDDGSLSWVIFSPDQVRIMRMAALVAETPSTRIAP